MKLRQFKLKGDISLNGINDNSKYTADIQIQIGSILDTNQFLSFSFRILSG